MLVNFSKVFPVLQCYLAKSVFPSSEPLSIPKSSIVSQKSASSKSDHMLAAFCFLMHNLVA